jgi:hypothetical protein
MMFLWKKNDERLEAIGFATNGSSK